MESTKKADTAKLPSKTFPWKSQVANNFKVNLKDLISNETIDSVYTLIWDSYISLKCW